MQFSYDYAFKTSCILIGSTMYDCQKLCQEAGGECDLQCKYQKPRCESEKAFTKGKAKYRNISATSKPKINPGLPRPKTEHFTYNEGMKGRHCLSKTGIQMRMVRGLTERSKINFLYGARADHCP